MTTTAIDRSLPPPVSLALLLARWFEQRLHESMAAHSPLLRLYAVDVLDVDAMEGLAPLAARVQFVAEGPTLDSLSGHPGLDVARAADAVAFVSARWMAPAGGAARPGEFVRRRRARVVQVVVDDASATVARFDDAPDVVVISPAA